MSQEFHRDWFTLLLVAKQPTEVGPKASEPVSVVGSEPMII